MKNTKFSKKIVFNILHIKKKKTKNYLNLADSITFKRMLDRRPNLNDMSIIQTYLIQN